MSTSTTMTTIMTMVEIININREDTTMKLIKNITVLLIVALVLGSCAQKGGATHEEHHHDEHLQITAYDTTYELFAEARPFVLGRTSNILAHFTHLSNFKPLTTGSVTTSIIIEKSGIRQKLSSPTKPGIYYFELTPTVAGRGTLLFEIESPEGDARIEVPIRVYADAHGADHAAADAIVESSHGATFTKEQSWKIDFATEKAKMEPLGEVIHTTAQILPAQGDRKQVVAKTSGIVTFVANDILVGKAVEAHTTLFTIESSAMAETNMGVVYNQARIEYERAKAEYERKKLLIEERIITQTEFVEAESQFLQAETKYQNLRKNFSENGQVVAAQLSGYITEVLVSNGQYVEAGALLAVVAQNRKLLVRADVAPRYYPNLSQISGANLKPTSGGKMCSLEELSGKLLSYSQTIEEDNPLLTVMFQVENTQALLPGSFVEMYIQTASQHEVITVPRTALVEEMGNFFVFRQLTPELFEKTEVTVGNSDGVRTEIVAGLQEGERVVSKGAILVKLAQAAGALDPHSGHVH